MLYLQPKKFNRISPQKDEVALLKLAKHAVLPESSSFGIHELQTHR